MDVIWVALAALVLFAGARYRKRLKSRGGSGTPTLNDAAIQRIIRDGTLPNPQGETRADRKAAAEAEAEFWSEYWDEPDEYQP